MTSVKVFFLHFLPDFCHIWWLLSVKCIKGEIGNFEKSPKMAKIWGKMKKKIICTNIGYNSKTNYYIDNESRWSGPMYILITYLKSSTLKICSKQKSIICYITTKYFKVSFCKFIRSDTVGTKYFLQPKIHTKIW